MALDETTRVYPRPRGGAHANIPAWAGTGGLSPPTRESPLHGIGLHPVQGSIPAHAGEPSLCARVMISVGVYPRPRGGASDDPRHLWPDWGLSPPTRGSPPSLVPYPIGRGSIPAHAGEPERYHAKVVTNWVYPRPRGGARSRMQSACRWRGLSPPTRGSLITL